MTDETTGDKNSQAFEEARKAVLPLFFDAVRENSPNIGAELQNSLASLGATMLARQATQGQQAKPPEPPQEVSPPAPAQPTKPPARQEAKPNPKGNEVMQLELPLPERARAVSNIAVRSALFAAIQGEDRELLHKFVLASQEGIQIIFSGEQLNQDDHDLFMQLVYLANHKPLGELVRVPANAILAGLGRGTGKSQHEQLKKEMHRLVAAVINLKAYGITADLMSMSNIKILPHDLHNQSHHPA
jgi:hypothetical protein